MQDTQKIVNFVTTSNWILLLFGGMIGLMMTPMKFALGIILGGLIVAINFHLLKNTLKNMFRPEVVSEQGRSLVGNVLVKYYIRFAISGMLIFLLISKHNTGKAPLLCRHYSASLLIRASPTSSTANIYSYVFLHSLWVTNPSWLVLPGSSIILSPRATCFHPGRPIQCTY